MGLAEVERAVHRATASVISQAENEASKEAEALLSNNLAHIVSDRELFDRHTKQIIEALERKENAKASAASKAITLSARRTALDEIFSLSLEKLSNQSEEERQIIISSLAERAKREIPNVAVVQCRPEDESLVRKSFPKASIEINDKISGGIIAIDKQGDVRSELTYKTLLAIIREREMPSVARILFT